MGADAKHIKTRKLAALKVVNVRNSVDLQMQISRIKHYKKASKAIYRASCYWSDGREGCNQIGTRVREGRRHPKSRQPKSTVEVIRKRIGTCWNGGSSENDGGGKKTNRYSQSESPVFSKLIRPTQTTCNRTTICQIAKILISSLFRDVFSGQTLHYSAVQWEPGWPDHPGLHSWQSKTNYFELPGIIE